MLVDADENSVLTAVTSATLIIIEAAVIAVRRGLRAELRRPSCPGTDQENSRPSRDTTGRPSSGVSSATAMNDTSTPPRITHSVLACALPDSPQPSSP